MMRLAWLGLGSLAGLLAGLAGCAENTVVGVERGQDAGSESSIDLLTDGPSLRDSLAYPDTPLAPPAEGAVLATCVSTKQCGSDSFCQTVQGDCSGKGACTLIPKSCAMPPLEVCGCDGKTWASACAASESSVSVAKPGPCL